MNGIVIHRDVLVHDEYRTVSGIAATTPARTAFDLGRRKGRILAVTRLDALSRETSVTAADIVPLIYRHRGVRGLVQLRTAVDLMDGGAESPQETRTRLVLIGAGLPKPRTQIPVLRYRVDMGYEQFKIGIEYDGEQHWTNPGQFAKDIDRLAELAAADWRIIRVSAEILRCRPRVIIQRTCEALIDAGADWPVVAQILAKNV